MQPKKKKEPKYYETHKTPIVIGETIAGVNRFGAIKVWQECTDYKSPDGDTLVFQSTDGSRLWLVERLKDGTPHIWRSCDINRLRRGLAPKVNKCEMWYRRSDPALYAAEQMEQFFKPAMAWAEKTLKHLKEQAGENTTVAPADPIKVKLTSAQMYNVVYILTQFRDTKKLTLSKSTVIFDPKTYQDVAKQVLMRLETRKASLRHDKQGRTEARVMEEAMRKIAAGDTKSDAPERDVQEWLDQYQDEQDDAHWQKKEAEIVAAPSSVTVIIDESDQVEGD